MLRRDFAFGRATDAAQIARGAQRLPLESYGRGSQHHLVRFIQKWRECASRFNLEAFSTRFAVLAGSQRSCNVIAAYIGSGARLAYDSLDHTARGGAEMVGLRETLVLSLSIWLSAYASTASGQVTAGYDGYGDNPISSAIRKAEQLRHAGEFPEAYRVLCSVRNGQTGRTGAALMNCIGSALQDLGRLDEAEQHYRRSLRMFEGQFGSDDPDQVLL